MRLVRALLAAEVRALAIVGAVLGAKTLLRGPGLNQRAVHGEVLVTHKLLRPQVNLREEALRDIARQKAVAVLGKHRVVPHRIVHAQADKPTKQQVIVDLLDQQPLRANGIKYLQQQGPQNVLRRNRRPARVRIQHIELRAQRTQHRVRKLANRTQRMVHRNPLLQRNIAEHPILYPLISTHVG